MLLQRSKEICCQIVVWMGTCSASLFLQAVNPAGFGMPCRKSRKMLWLASLQVFCRHLYLLALAAALSPCFWPCQFLLCIPLLFKGAQCRCSNNNKDAEDQ